MLEVTYRGEKGRFATVNTNELYDELARKFGDRFNISHRVFDKSHLKAATKIGGGNKTFITMRQKEGITLPSGEVVFPQLMLRDQNYPGASMVITYGLYRLVCSNGAMAFSHIAAPVRIPHFKNRTDVFIYLADVIEASNIKFLSILKEVGRLQVAAIDNPLLTLTTLNLSKSVKEKVEEIITAGTHRPEDNPLTAWGLYNIINEVDRLKARKNSVAYLTRDARFDMTQLAV